MYLSNEHYRDRLLIPYDMFCAFIYYAKVSVWRSLLLILYAVLNALIKREGHDMRGIFPGWRLMSETECLTVPSAIAGSDIAVIWVI